MYISDIFLQFFHEQNYIFGLNFITFQTMETESTV